MTDHDARAFWRRVAILLLALVVCRAANAFAQQTREEELAGLQADKAKGLHPYVPTPLERRLELAEHVMTNPPPFFPFVGSIFPGGLLAFGPRYQSSFGGTGSFDAHAAWSLANYKAASVTVHPPELAERRVSFDAHA